MLTYITRLRPVKHRVLGCTYSEQSNLHWSNSEDDIEDQKLINTNGWTFVHLYLQILRTKCGQHSANQQQLELRNPFSEVSLEVYIDSLVILHSSGGVPRPLGYLLALSTSAMCCLLQVGTNIPASGCAVSPSARYSLPVSFPIQLSPVPHLTPFLQFLEQDIKPLPSNFVV